MQKPVVLPGKVIQRSYSEEEFWETPLSSINTHSVTNREIKTTQFGSGL